METHKDTEKPSSANPAVARTWAEFRDTGMLWWANRALQVFGWVIVVNVDDETGEVLGAEPRRSVWRGFSPESEARGFERVTAWMRENAEDLIREVSED